MIYLFFVINSQNIHTFIIWVAVVAVVAIRIPEDHQACYWQMQYPNCQIQWPSQQQQQMLLS
jgi:hypothetical protein